MSLRPRTQNWSLHKPAARGRDGIVVAQSRDAACAGAAVLEAGGNAADAAVATCLALAASEPWNSGLGGIGFALVLPPGAQTAHVVDFGPVSPRHIDPTDYPLTGRVKTELFTWPEVEGDRNVHGPLSFCIPSAVAGYAKMLEAFGSNIPVAGIVDPAIALARRGLTQDWFTTLKIAAAAPALRQYNESARIYLRDGLPPVPPQSGLQAFMKLGRLEETLTQLRDAGFDDFYRGKIAARLVADIAALSGKIDAEDLESCAATIRDADVIDWRGEYRINTAGGLTAAPTLGAVIAGMRDAPLGKTPVPEWFAQLSHVMRRAYADRLEHAGAGVPRQPEETCTSHVTVVDRSGMLVSVTTTLLSSMGSRVVLPATGVLMNNGIMWFDPRPGTPNAIRPDARPLCNMCPVIATPISNNRPNLAAGASGGRRILASVYQMLAWAIDFDMDVEIAAHAPRIDVSGPDETTADERLPAEVIEALHRTGPLSTVEHTVVPINFACPNMIRATADGAEGCADVASPWSAAIAAGPSGNEVP